MAARERCLQMSTGSCAGCDVRDVILQTRLRATNGDIPREEVISVVAKEWCPSDARMQPPERPRIKVW